jgi:Fe-S cluster assembly protein SufD
MITTASPEVQRYLAQFAAAEPSLARVGPLALQRTRQAALARFAHLGFPTTKQEGWRATPVAPVVETAFAPAAPVDLDPPALGRLGVATWPGPRLVVVNGRFAPRLSRLTGLAAGVTVGSLAEALARTPAAVEPHLARHADWQTHPFRALNTAFLADGAFVHVPRGVALEFPIQLVFVSTAPGEPTVSHPRALVLVDPGAQATVVEGYLGLGEGRYFTNAVTEIVLGEGAVLDHYVVTREADAAVHFAGRQVRQARSSALTTTSLSLGGLLVRNDLGVTLAEEGAECTLYGLYLADGRDLIDNHTTIDHASPHCASTELYKGVVGGRARAVFNGRIVVRPDAQKTDARQTNKNLLLSNDAVVDTRPELEIFANDVKCTHGATLGQLEADALFYLQARGVPEATARGILMHAFAADVIERVRVPELRALLDEQLLTVLPNARKG